MPPLFLVMFPGEAPESYIAPASRLYPPFGRVIFCRRRRQSLGVRAVRARFYSDVPQRCHSVAPPYKNVPPRAALLNICPKGANISHAQSAYFTAAKRRFHTAAKLAAYHFGSQNNYSQRFAAVFHCGGTAAYSPSIISFRVARFLSKSKSSTAMPRTFAFSHVPSAGMCAGSISHSRIIGSSFTA